MAERPASGSDLLCQKLVGGMNESSINPTSCQRYCVRACTQGIDATIAFSATKFLGLDPWWGYSSVAVGLMVLTSTVARATV